MTYDVEGPDPVPRRSLTRPLRTGIVLLLLAVAVLVAGRWGWTQVTQPFGDVTAATSPSPEAGATPTCTPAPDEQRLPPPRRITVNVYNAGSIAGLAGSTATELAEQGFTIGAVDNDPLGKRLEGVGEVRSAPKSENRVKRLLQYLPGATWVQDGRADTTVDFAVGAGFEGVTEPPKPDEKAAENDDIPTC